MRKRAKSNRTRSVQPRFRIHCDGDIALGPGKADLLALIGQTGSINQAAKRMGLQRRKLRSQRRPGPQRDDCDATLLTFIRSRPTGP